MDATASEPAILALKAVWTELLEVDDVAEGDNFIEQGGNSLLATILVARVEDATGVALDLQDLFEMSYGQLTEVAAAIHASPDRGDS